MFTLATVLKCLQLSFITSHEINLEDKKEKKKLVTSN